MKKLTIGKLQKLLWQECRRVADILYPPVNGKHYCFTCGNPIEGKNKQLGHFIPKSVCGAYLKYDMRNLRWQCYRCNINLSGNGAIFYDKLLKECTQEFMDQIMADKNKIIKAYDHYQKLLSDYEKIQSL